jgi:hypothetical protein
MDGLSGAVDECFGELFSWLTERGLAPAGPPLIRYHVVNMAGDLQIELAVPVAAPVSASGRIQPGELPAGRYLVLRHTGPYDGLMASNEAVQRWAAEHGIGFDCWDTPEGQAWRARTEHYLTNPAEEPDPAKWETDVAFLTSGG